MSDDWLTMDLKKWSHERSKNLVDNYTFNDLILEAFCNLKPEELNHKGLLKLVSEHLDSQSNQALKLTSLYSDTLIEIVKAKKNGK